MCLVSILYSIKISLLLVTIILFISSNLWTILWLSNFIFSERVEINAILLVNFIISIGISVEFCIHSIVRYIKAKGTHKDKINKVFKDILPAVFSGIFLTKLIGLSVLFFSPIPLFVIYYFRVFIAMILVCGFYGLVVIPCLLDTFGLFLIRKLRIDS